MRCTTRACSSVTTRSSASVCPSPSVRAAVIHCPSFDLLRLPRPRATAPWAYVKIAEGCDRNCGFCAIPTFRGPQRSRDIDDILREVDELGAREIVLVAQDLASFGRDQGQGDKRIVPLVRAVTDRVDWVRLLYLYPSDLTDELITAVLDTGVPYFDLSLQHVSRPLMRRMRRWGDGQRFLDRIASIRQAAPDAAFRTNFIVGYPGETEADHDELLAFVTAAELDWCGFFSYSREDGTYAATLDGSVPSELVGERLAELRGLQDQITAAKRDELIGCTVEVLVDAPGQARSFREAPEIDGTIAVPTELPVGEFATVEVTDALGPDLVAHRRRSPRCRCDRGGAVSVPEQERRIDPESNYGPSAIATPANFLTVIRLLVAPVLFAMIFDQVSTWPNVILWTILVATDGVDGIIARRHGTTRSGAFLDPLADKVLILGALFALVAADALPLLPVAIIAVREIGISLYRVQLGRQGLAVPARLTAKIKTFLQSLTVGAVLLALDDVVSLDRQCTVVGFGVHGAFQRVPVPARRSPSRHNDAGRLILGR